MAEERRQFPRFELDRPVKVRCDITGRYLAAQTLNLSDGGASLDIDHPSLLVPGQALRLGIAMERSAGLLASEDFVAATVLRAKGAGGRQRVAVQFAQAQSFELDQPAAEEADAPAPLPHPGKLHPREAAFRPYPAA